MADYSRQSRQVKVMLELCITINFREAKLTLHVNSLTPCRARRYEKRCTVRHAEKRLQNQRGAWMKNVPGHLKLFSHAIATTAIALAYARTLSTVACSFKITQT